MTDFSYRNEGSLVLLRPRTELAEDWLDDHIDGEALYFANALVIEPRYFFDILSGLTEDGLTALPEGVED